MADNNRSRVRRLARMQGVGARAKGGECQTCGGSGVCHACAGLGWHDWRRARQIASDTTAGLREMLDGIGQRRDATDPERLRGPVDEITQRRGGNGSEE